MKQVKWITAHAAVPSLPRLRRDFALDELPPKVLCRISGLGFYALYLNGERADEARLAPNPSRYDVRTWFREIDVTRFLHPGKNCCEIRLGGGWYAGDLADVWGGQYASYRNVPKAALRLFSEHRTLLKTDETWLSAAGPVLADSPRNGEQYDARKETPEKWLPVRILPPPGGKLVRSDAPPVLPQPPVAPVQTRKIAPGTVLYDFGVNLCGTVKIALRGPAGSRIVLRYGELCKADGSLTQENIDWYCKRGEFQTDSYVLAGRKAGECWQPEFSWHGFRYVQAEIPEGVTVREIAAIPLRSGFAAAGEFDCGDPALAELLTVTRRTLESNFAGYPTDCPHREKNGWTADAQLASDSLLCWFDAVANYEEFVETIFDYQRPSGQLPGMVPGSGFGGHWDFGPIWDSAALLLGYRCWQYGGSDQLLHRHYRDLCRYLDFCRDLKINGLLSFGPGDWCQPPEVPSCDPQIIASCYYYRNLRLMETIAIHFGNAADATAFANEASVLRSRIALLPCRHVTEYGVLLECGLGGAAEAEKLHQLVQDSGCKAQFGIAGAKAVPRALAEYGYVDDAYRFFTQPEFPGWQWILRQGATTLWETWNGNQSQNHPMFGDAAGWAFRYLAGIRITAPGFRKVRIAPQFPQALERFGWSGRTAGGEWSSRWSRRKDGSVEVQIGVPPEGEAELLLPHQEPRLLTAGEYRLRCRGGK